MDSPNLLRHHCTKNVNDINHGRSTETTNEMSKYNRILTVRQITKSSSPFSATDIGSNMIWFLLYDAIKMKLNHTGINYNHNNIAIRSHIIIYNSVENLIFATKFSRSYLAKGQKRLVFQLSFVNLQRAKDGTHMFDAKYRYVFVV